jgi:para-nitrobenzyl esterase
LLETTADGLRHIEVERLLDAQGQLARGIARFADIAPPFMPVFDGLTDPAAFIAAAAASAGARGIDMIIGTTREEMGAFFAADPGMAAPDPRQVANRFKELVGDPDAIELYRRRRPGGGVAELLGDLVTDHLFLFPSLALAEASAAPAYVYQFDWAPPASRFGACHCIDLPFSFGTLDAWPDAGMLDGGKVYEMQQLAAAMCRAWSAFAYGGPPDAPGLPWPAYVQGSRLTMVFGTILGAVGDPAGAVWRGGAE